MFEVTGGSWGATPNVLGDPGGVVTWSFAEPGEVITIFPSAGVSVDPNLFLTIDYEAIFTQAFADWSAHGDIEFMQVEDQGGSAGDGLVADIRIFFGSLPGTTIGWAFFPPSSSLGGPRRGDILIDNQFSFNSNISQFTGLVLHEIGHAIGLEHVPNGSQSVMTPTINLDALTQADMDGIEAVYGAQDNAAPVHMMAEDQLTLSVINAPSNITINGNTLDNPITTAADPERITGAGGDDTIRSGGGFDTLFGGTGNDLLDGGDQADALYGEAGNDHLFGGAGFDRLHGGAGDDTLEGGTGPDRLFGDAGDDLLIGGSNVGGTVDGLFGGAGNDTLIGGGGFDYLDGGAQADILWGGTNADNLFGRDGDDTLFGEGGLDRLFGGGGEDSLNGGSGNDGLFGQFGNDTLYGEAGNDRFFGGTGNDINDGGEGSDTIFAGAGFDTLIGGLGDDRLQGDFNADTFVFEDGHGNDTITDFNATNVFEVIDLSAVSAITSLDDLLTNYTDQVGGNVLIETGGGNSITLNNVAFADLDASDFIF